MPHGDLAQLSAVIGGLGAAAMLLSRTRAQLLAGLAVTAVGEATLAAALVPAADLKLLVAPAGHAATLVVGVLLVGAGAVALTRYPAIVPVALLAAAPFRISVSIGAQKAYLLVPLYIVLAAAFLALLFRALRGDVGRPLPPLLAVPAAAFVALAGLSLLWTRDLRQGTIELLFFLFPFSVLVVAVARSPFRSWHPRALATTVVALAGVFSAVALFQRLTHGHLLAGDVARANAYTTYFRVTSPFKDPSIFGRHVVIAIAVLLLAVELRRALRGRRRGVVPAGRAEDAARAARRRCLLRSRRSGFCRRHRGKRLRAPGDEWPDAARQGDVGRLHESSRGRGGDRRPAAGEQGRGEDTALRKARPLAHDAADGRSRARHRRPACVRGSARRGHTAALVADPSESSSGTGRVGGLPRPVRALALLFGFLRGPDRVGRDGACCVGLGRTHARARAAAGSAEPEVHRAFKGRRHTTNTCPAPAPGAAGRLVPLGAPSDPSHRGCPRAARRRRGLGLLPQVAGAAGRKAGPEAERRHGVGRHERPCPEAAQEEERSLPRRGRQALLGQLRCRSATDARAAGHRHRAAPRALLGRRARVLHRISAQLLQRDPLCEHVRGPHGGARLS